MNWWRRGAETHVALVFDDGDLAGVGGDGIGTADADVSGEIFFAQEFAHSHDLVRDFWWDLAAKEIAEDFRHLFTRNVDGWRENVHWATVHELQDKFAEVGLPDFVAAIGQTLAQMDLFAEHGFAFDDGLFAAGDLVDDVDDLLRILGKIRVAVVALDGIHRLRHQCAPILVGILLDLLHFLGQRWCVRITLQGFSEIFAIGRDGAGDRCADAFVLAGFVDVLGVGVDIFFDRTHSLYPFARNSTKSMIGHLLGAAGAVEFITCVKELEEGYIHRTVGYETPDDEMDLNYCKEESHESFTYALSNSLGFGGHNASLLVRKYEE